MTITQTLNHDQENSYDDDIKITDIPASHFPAVTANTIAAGSNTREITVQIMPLEQAPGGTMATNSGLYVRQADETEVKVSVYQDDKLLADNTQAYS